MTRYVALFRGINVGKAKRIAMADLRALLEAQGYTQVSTLLNSGNAMFDAAQGSQAVHAKRIEAAVAAELGVASKVVVKSAAEIDVVVGDYPLAAVATDPSRTFVTLTADAPSLAVLKAFAELDWGSGARVLGAHALYLWCPEGALENKASIALPKHLGDSGTTRNWATLLKMQLLLKP